MAIGLILLGIALLVVGGALTTDTPATQGVFLTVVACFCGILARIAQAYAHQKQVIEELRALRSTSEKP